MQDSIFHALKCDASEEKDNQDDVRKDAGHVNDAGVLSDALDHAEEDEGPGGHEAAGDGKVEVVSINCGVEKLDGFSGHSDYNQLMSFVQRLRPKLRRVLVNHGERKKSENLAMNIRRMYKVPAHYPQVQEAIKLF